MVGKAAGQFLRDRDRARIGQRAIIQARTGDDIGDQIDVRRRDTNLVERFPEHRQIALGDMGQRQVLLVADADFAEGISVGEIGDRVHLVGGGIAGRAAHRLQRQRHDRIALHLVRKHRILAPAFEQRVVRRLLQLVRHMRQLLIGGIGKARADFLDVGVIQRQRAVAQLLPLFLDLLGELLDAELVHQDLDARLVDIVAAAVLVVDPQDRLDITQEIAAVNERLDGLADKGRAAEPAADQHFEAGLAVGVLDQTQADIVDLDRRAIVLGGGDREFELARQEREFRMQRGVLPQKLRPDAGILDLAGRHAGPLVRGDIAGVVARSLHRVDADFGQIGQRVRQFGELDPVVLDVLPGGEMTVAAVVAARDMRQPPQPPQLLR